MHYGPQKIAFRPFILLEGEGIAVDILMQGLIFFDAQIGITTLKMTSQGQCICGVSDEKDERVSTEVYQLISCTKVATEIEWLTIFENFMSNKYYTLYNIYYS